MILTNLVNHTEGAGSLYQMYVTAWILCKMYNKKYIHNIPEYIHHYKSNNVELEKFINDWELIFAFLEENNDNDNDNYDNKEVEIVEMSTSLNTFLELSDNFYYYITNTKELFDSSINLFDKKVKIDLREQYHKKLKYIPKNILWKESSSNSNKIINIAIHIRNLNDDDIVRDKRSKTWELFTVDYDKTLNHKEQGLYYKKLLMRISEIINEYNCKKIIETDGTTKYEKFTYNFHIFSQGQQKQFEIFYGIPNINIHLNNYAPDDFWHFTKADILILGRSSFSYLASLLNNNVKIIKSIFRHQLPSETVILNKKGVLKEVIYKYLEEKENVIKY